MYGDKKVANNNGNTALKPMSIVAIVVSAFTSIFLLGLLFVTSKGILDFDYVIVNRGIDILCSDSFRQKLAAQISDSNVVINLDYQCQRNDDAKKYYIQGFHDYQKSQGLPVENSAD